MENGILLLLAKVLSNRLNNIVNIIYIIAKAINFLMSSFSQIIIAIGNCLNLPEMKHSRIASVTINLGIFFYISVCNYLYVLFRSVKIEQPFYLFSISAPPCAEKNNDN